MRRTRLIGRHGFDARKRLQLRSDILATEIVRTEAVRAMLARDTALLSTETPHPDLIQELAGELLGFVAPGARVMAR